MESLSVVKMALKWADLRARYWAVTRVESLVDRWVDSTVVLSAVRWAGRMVGLRVEQMAANLAAR